MQFHILHPPNETFTQTQWMDTRHVWVNGTCTFSLSHFELRVSNLHVGMWSCNVRHGNTENFHAKSAFPFWFSSANISISSEASAIFYVRIRKTPEAKDTGWAQPQSSKPRSPDMRLHKSASRQRWNLQYPRLSFEYVTGLSINFVPGGRTGNSVLITVNTGRFLSSPPRFT